MESKSTPGPWTAIAGKIYFREDGQRWRLGVCYIENSAQDRLSRKPTTAEDFKNARLMAAAPELLREAERALSSGAIKFADNALDRGIKAGLEAAIAKAKGE